MVTGILGFARFWVGRVAWIGRVGKGGAVEGGQEQEKEMGTAAPK